MDEQAELDLKAQMNYGGPRYAGFDPRKDFEPVSPVATAGYVLVANPNFAANNVAELIAAVLLVSGRFASIGAVIYVGVQAVRGFDASRFDADGRS